MNIKSIVLLLVFALVMVSPITAQDDDVIPPDPNIDEYDWYVASDGIVSPPIMEISTGPVTNSPVTGLEGGSAWGQASIFSKGLYVEGKSRTGLTSAIHNQYNICAAVEWLKRGSTQIASNPALHCKYASGPDEVSRTASDAWEVLPAVYSTRTRHYVEGNGFLWDEYDEVSS